MLFRGSAKAVAAERMAGSLFMRLSENFAHQHGYRPSASEALSWERSIPMLLDALLDAGLDDVEVLLEYQLPLTSRRADVVLAGVHPRTGEPSYVVVELKQWSSAEPDDESPTLCQVGDYPGLRLNPIEQVRGYCDYLVGFNGAVADDPHRVSGVVYLHNATESGVQGLREVGQDRHGRLFSREGRGALIDHLQTLLGKASGASAADELLNAKKVPSKQLMTVAAEEVREREQFVLLDAQKLAYELVLRAVERARRNDHKEVVVVLGGPGTGKSVIALSLLGELFRQGHSALHATGSRSFTLTMRKVAGARKPAVQKLFKYFNDFIDIEKNSLDVLICDEAHRIRETSSTRWTPAAHRTGRAQVEELLDAARVPVFLLDENQVVRPGEFGTEAQIVAAAEAKGLSVHVVRLDDQFRCGGSEAYLTWVNRLLGLTEGGPADWQPDGLVGLHVVDSPTELEDFLKQRQAEEYGARMTAGYCWRWSPEPKSGEPLAVDVRIGGWERPWNLRGDRALSGAPPAALWATDPAGFGQVGCVYTAQGFEYDWSGVILGPDLVWRGDHWVVDRTASKDPVFTKATSDAEVDRLIRHTYKVLLTRGMIGTVIYSTDAETRERLRELVPAAPAAADRLPSDRVEQR
ncbi:MULTISPECIES: DNA/RNA helicase domain-containing protein [unclassified Kitasatospora]|uniref:DNA/RNA helicase domain-containing protein n=1 Tax=unclassified Kitasatospora TaxID=2633591 RepID=UPI00070B7BEC|nr:MULTISPECIES: DNA/RNA helicase domain-containing protein [unclassified Kitasatospora]KQV13245.1 ATP-binding protein [Kitasatospora sp. Root107]KRB75306.1 ATP-binding protein [Kitasatospora sp. Root187]